MKNHIAHKRVEDGAEQSVEEHLRQVAELAGEYAKVFGGADSAYICGLLHDLGKFSDEFYKRIKENGPKCDHSTAGAQMLKLLNPNLGAWLAYVILGHHGGMPDFGARDDEELGTYFARMSKNIPDYSDYTKVFNDDQFRIKEPPLLKDDTDWGYKISFWVRMIYSCVVDADYLDTEKFMTINETDRNVNVDFAQMQEKINKEISNFKQDTIVNKYRKQILDDCLEAAINDPGMFSLTVPTGGGKTIASAAFALKHLLHNNDKLRRIIYVIPYCSIIEQNAQVFSNIFGDNVVLEHHSNFDFDDEENELNNKKRLASENWNMPFIVTTNVQFFESLYSNKPSKCRKLHNIAGSVIIFDEVQAIPNNYLAPCMRAIEELVREYNCSAVLCSATQPKLESFFHYKMPIYEMCKKPNSIFKALKRTNLTNLEEISMWELEEKIEQGNQVLAILNKKDTTKALYENLKSKNCKDIYHLSTYMCPEHRRNVISEIRTRLKKGLDCKVISTNLIEAGVDLDFQEVYREMTGIDSIIQAAGRANREGRRQNLGEVYVFSFKEPEYRVSNIMPLGQYLDKCGQNAIKIIDKYDDVFLADAVDDYFTNLYQDMAKQEFDGKGILKLIKDFYVNDESKEQFQFYFKELSKMFKLIEEDTFPILVPFDQEAEEEIKKMASPYYIITRKDIRANQKYMVNVRAYEYLKMLEENRIVIITDKLAFLSNSKEYKDDTGLEKDVEFGIGIFIEDVIK